MSPETATVADVPEIVALVQSAYRGDSGRAGWTTESDLLDDERTTEDSVAALVTASGSVMLLRRAEDGSLIGCCHLERRGDDAYFGMFAVRPTLQASGLGTALLAEAEAYAWREWGATAVEMTVIDVRHELLAWYARRGYVDTGERRPYPTPGTPVQFAVLRKAITDPAS